MADDGSRIDQVLEDEGRFPSGPWTGFFLQPGSAAKHWMDLALTFRGGVVKGDGHDRVGSFLVRGRYEVESGKAWWTKQYVGKHALHYQGYNEGRGIWGVWEFTAQPVWRGGFHVWPVAMDDPTKRRLAEELDEPPPLDLSTLSVTGAEAP